MRYADLAGMDSVLQDVVELIERPLRHPEVRLLGCSCCPDSLLPGVIMISYDELHSALMVTPCFIE